MKDHRYWLALKQVPGVGNVLYKRLIETYKHPEVIFDAAESSLLQVEGMSKGVAKEIHGFKVFDGVDQELDRIEKEGAALLTLGDPYYPQLLSAIYDPPPLLYVKGNWKTHWSYPIAVVGTRKTTPYGRMVTERLCRALAEQSVTIVSGFARGVDGQAHRTAISAGGETLAVLGCGIDVIYPPEHKKLFHDVLENGAVFSEFPMGSPPVSHNFPRRNRIISGLSLGCIVVEATDKSGSLITARLALEQGREVFAIPGSIFSAMSSGPHQLISCGAKLVRSVADVLDEIFPQSVSRCKVEESKEAVAELEADEAIVFNLLSIEPKHIDLLILESKKPVSTVSGLLLSLELKGVVRQMAGQYYAKV